MSQKLPIDGFKWIEENNISRFNESFIKNYGENSDKGCLLEVDVKYPENLRKLHNDLPFLPERKKIAKIKKLVFTVQGKENYVVHIRASKQALNHGLTLKKYTEHFNSIKNHG